MGDRSYLRILAGAFEMGLPDLVTASLELSVVTLCEMLLEQLGVYLTSARDAHSPQCHG